MSHSRFPLCQVCREPAHDAVDPEPPHLGHGARDRRAAVPGRGLDAVKIYDEPITLLCSTRNPLAGAEGLALENLAAESVLTFSVQLICDMVDDAKARACADEWSDGDTLLDSAFYRQ